MTARFDPSPWIGWIPGESGNESAIKTVKADEELEDQVMEPARIDESHFEVLVVVDPDELYLIGAVAELGTCQYDT